MALSHENGIRNGSRPGPTAAFGIVFWALALAFLGLLFWRRGGFRRRGCLKFPGGTWSCSSASLVMLVLAARAIRNTCVFLLIAVPAASRLLGADFRFRKRDGRSEAGAPDHPRVNLALLIGVSALEALGVLFAWQSFLSGPRLATDQRRRAGGRARLSRTGLRTLQRRRSFALVRPREAGLLGHPSGPLSVGRSRARPLRSSTAAPTGKPSPATVSAARSCRSSRRRPRG